MDGRNRGLAVHRQGGRRADCEAAQMNEAEVKRIVAEAVEETLTKLGFDVAKPMEAQKDMQFLREWRESAATVKKQSLITAVGVVTVGVLGLIWLAVRGGSPT